MKTTIDLPDDLMIEVKVVAARERRKLGELVTELVRTGLAQRLAQPPEDAEERRAAEQWLDDWFKLADAVMQDASPGPTARDLLEEDRNRLERP